MSIFDTITTAFNNLTQLTKKTSYNSGSNDNYSLSNSKYGTYVRLADRDTDNLSYRQYKNIMKDTQVKVGLEILKYFLISKNYTLTSNSDDEQDVQITEFVQDALDNMETPFREVHRNIITAIRYGFSVQEKVYTLTPEHKITFKGIYPLHIKTLQNLPFIRNDKGELIGIHQESQYGTVDLPLKKCLIYSFDKEFDELEGESILNNLKPVVEDKEDIMDWLMTYANKNESPVMYGKTDDPTHSHVIQTALDNVAAGATSMVIGSNDDVGVLESSHRGEAYFNLLNYNDNRIFRRMFLGSLLLGSGDQTGSYAQSYTQENVLHSILDGILTDSGQVFQQGINELVTMNFGVSAKSPAFNFDKFTKKEIINLLNTIKGFIDNGSFDSDNQAFKELLAQAFLTEADIKLDLNSVNDNTEDDVDFGYQPPMPGESEANDLIDEQLEGII